ncbi:MAG: CHAT domain-containing tetratricopeptide repeat protein [Bacteroidota bacterium]
MLLADYASAQSVTERHIYLEIEGIYKAAKYEEVIAEAAYKLAAPEWLSDSIQASLLNFKGNALRRLGQRETAMNTHKEALRIREKVFGKNSLAVANSNQNIGNCLLELGRPATALSYLNKTKTIRSNQLSSHHPKLGSIYISLAYAHQQLNNFEQAYFYNEQALAIKKHRFGACSPLVVPAMLNLAQLRFELKEISKAKALYEEVLYIQLDSVDRFSPATALAYTGLGNCSLEEGMPEHALHQHLRALEIYEHKEVSAIPQKKAICYQNIGNVYLYKGDLDQAIAYYQRAVFSYDDPSTKTVLKLKNNIGLCHRHKGDLNKALQLFDEITSQYGDAADLFLAHVHENIGSCLFDMEAFQEAAIYYTKALNYYEAQPSLTKNYYQCLSKIGDCRFELNFFEESLDIFREISQHISAQNEETKAMHHYKIGRIYQKQSEHSDALNQFSLAIRQIEKLDYTPYELLISVLLAQGQSQHKIAANKTDLLEALNTFRTAKRWMQTASLGFVETTANIYLNDRFSQLYDGLVGVSFDLGKYRLAYHQIAYQYAEENKAAVLKKQLERKIPQDSLDQIQLKEQAIRKQLSAIDQVIFEESQYVIQNGKRLKWAYEQQFAWKQKLKELLANSVHSNADSTTAINPKDIALLLNDQQSLLQYHLTTNDKKAFLFLIDQDTFQAIQIHLPDHFSQEVISFYQHLKTRPDLRSDSDEAYNLYAHLAYQFYQLLLQPLEGELRQELIVIPDKLLVFLPFETFLRQLPEQSNLFRNHAYLLHSYQFSYAYSAKLLQLVKEKSFKSYSKLLLAIAPSFEGEQQLRHNVPEAKAIVKLLGGKRMIAKKAQEHLFKKTVDQSFQILHFSTHGIANEAYPNFSYLALASPTDTTEDGKLYASEIRQLSIPADLVFLSACESNIGKYYKGEGFMSLSRAFTLAGAKSVIASLWKIDDEQTRYIVENTYKNLKQQMPRNQALNGAKLDYIQSSSHVKSHPYYWSALLLIGEEKVLELEAASWYSKNYVIYLLGFSILLLGGLYCVGISLPFYDKTANRQNKRVNDRT